MKYFDTHHRIHVVENQIPQKLKQKEAAFSSLSVVGRVNSPISKKIRFGVTTGTKIVILRRLMIILNIQQTLDPVVQVNMPLPVHLIGHTLFFCG